MALLKSSKILLIDSDQKSRNMLKQSLNNIGLRNIIEKEEVENFFLEHSQGDEIQIIFYDLNTGNSDFSEFYSKLIKNKIVSKNNFILVTGASDQDLIIKIKNLGINHILLKPYAQQKVINILATLKNSR